MLLLSVSLDGYGKTHDLNRNKDGIFDKIINNLDNLNSRKKRPMVDIKTIVLENNLDDLPKLFKLCDSKGFEFLSISFLRNNNLKQNSILHNSFIDEFNGNYPIKNTLIWSISRRFTKRLRVYKSVQMCVCASHRNLKTVRIPCQL